MKRVMISLITFLLTVSSANIYAMEQKKSKKHRKKTKVHYIEADNIKVRADSLERQKPETLVPLFTALHSSISVMTPKKDVEKTFAHSRAVYDALTKIYGNKTKAKVALNGRADDFSDEEKHMKEFFTYTDIADIADPSKVYLGWCSYTSIWKNTLYEEMKNKNQLCEKYNKQIVDEEGSLKELEDSIVETRKQAHEQIAKMQKQAQEQLEKIQVLNATKEHYESKFEAADKFSTEMDESLKQEIEEITNLIDSYNSEMNELDEQSSRLRSENLDVTDFNANTLKIANEKKALEDKIKEAKNKRDLLIACEDHISKNLPKASEEGSFARRYIWGKSF